MSASPPLPVPEGAPERETSSVELLWDLVFVFAVTQVTTLLAAQRSWGRFAQSMLVLVPGRLAFCGGVALYLVGVSAFRLRMLGELSRGRLSVAAALLVLFEVLKSAPAWTVGAGVTVLIVGLCALELLGEYRSSRQADGAAGTDGAPVAASPASQTVARVADPDHGLE
jgi:low temperature requirement protein LtrA